MTRIASERIHVLASVFTGALLMATGGCQAFKRDKAEDNNPFTASKPPSEVSLANGEAAQKDLGTRLVDYVTGGSSDGGSKAQDLYKQGDAVFRSAMEKPKKDAEKDYNRASKFFAKAAKAAPGSALEQDALFMQAESLFFANRLTAATDIFQKLQKEHPRSRHNDLVAARLFAISRYWIDAARAGDDSWYKFNLTDSKRPAYDAKGHAIRVLDQIRYDDPTGRLADDATMAAAAEYIRLEDFEKADEFLTDLRLTFTDSDHLFLAHLLGIKCKLELYAGPSYSGLVLVEAEDLVKKTRQRFPDRIAEKEYSDMLAKASAEVAFLRAQRLAYRATYRENRGENGAAKAYYEQLVADHPNTPQAESARKRLPDLAGKPAKPKRQMQWLRNLFPDAKSLPPLKLKSEVKQTSATASQ